MYFTCDRYKNWWFVFWIYNWSLLNTQDNCTNIAIIMCIAHINFFHQFFWLYMKNISFLQICTTFKSERTQKCIFHVICHVNSHIFITCETMNLNNQSCNCRNLANIYGVFQYSIIMEIMICKSSVSLLLSLLIFSSLFITLHDKHCFLKFVIQSRCPKTTHTWKCILAVIFYVIWCISMIIAVIIVICITVDRCSQHISFSVWTFSCYLHAYKTEWCHLYWALHIESFSWQLITCITCLVSRIYREPFSADRDILHPAHLVLPP